MKHWSLNIHRPHFGPIGRFSLIGAKVDWCCHDDLSDLGGWFSVQLALLGFSVCLTRWTSA